MKPKDLLAVLMTYDSCVRDVAIEAETINVYGVHDLPAMVSRLELWGYTDCRVHPCPCAHGRYGMGARRYRTKGEPGRTPKGWAPKAAGPRGQAR